MNPAVGKFQQYAKVAMVGFVIAQQITLGFAAKLFLKGKALRKFQISILQRSARLVLAILGVKVTVEKAANWRENQGYLVVSNHLSYLDTVIIASFQPVCFVSTIEVKETPVLGLTVEASGCLFVERRSRERLREEIKEMEQTLRDGFALTFFPEGTSSNGSSVLEFKSSLFAPAQRAGIPVLPAVIQLEAIDGKPITSANRDLFCWHGDMKFAPHLISIAGCEEIKVSLKILPEIPITEKISRDELSAGARAAIISHYHPNL